MPSFLVKNIFGNVFTYDDIINSGLNFLKTLSESLPVCKIWALYYFWFRS